MRTAPSRSRSRSTPPARGRRARTARSGENDSIAADIENLTGGSGNDFLRGSSIANIIHGGAGNDTIEGAAGNDALYGEAATTSLYGGAGNDLLVGGAAPTPWSAATAMTSSTRPTARRPATP